ncbi:MAG: HAMP domain-containing sensor histidine kinase [Candidatus Acidiferrales bacterium]
MSQAPVKLHLHRGLALPRLKLNWLIISAWIGFVGIYCFVSVAFRSGPFLTAFGDIALSLAAVFATVALLLNVFTPPRRTRAFWALMALGCGAWLVGQVIWTYFEVVLHQQVPNPFIGDVILFLHPVPMIGALALRPHDRRDDLKMHLGYVDFSLLLLWWIFVYLFAVIPWQYVSPDVVRYGNAFDSLEGVENLILAVGLGILFLRAKNQWRTIYAHLGCAALLFGIGAYISNIAIDKNLYYTGGPFDLPLAAALTWFGTAGLIAYQIKPESERARAHQLQPMSWPGRLAMVAGFSMPVLALWSELDSTASPAVRNFRVDITLLTLMVVGALIFLRHWLVDRDRTRLLRASEAALENLKHLQSQMIQTEKLVSLGQLAAGAAHEINNPLTGILGYSDMLVEEPGLSERQRAIADKISTLARRIKTLVANLLSFARRVPPERTLFDVSQIIASALNLSNLDMRGKNIRVDFTHVESLPAVRGDANQIMQVFFNLVDNAVDALEEVGGGILSVRSLQKDAQIVIEFSDTGPGIKSPGQVFDPFFTTKPAGKGTGLGLSICYGIVQEHAGTIECFNRPNGGATFRVTLPVASDAASDEHSVMHDAKA